MEIRILMMTKKYFLLLYFLGGLFSDLSAQLKVDKKLLSNGKIEIKVYHKNGNLYQHYYEMNGKKDSTFQQWFDDGSKEKRYFYIKGIKDGKWTKWYRRDGRIYREKEYNNNQVISIRKYSLKRSGGFSSLDEICYKKDSLIESRKVWYDQYVQLNHTTINKSFKSKKVEKIYRFWDKNGQLRKEEVINYKDKMRPIECSKTWNLLGHLQQETWVRRWKETTNDGYQMKEKLLRRKTYKDGKLIKDEKFE